MEKSEINQRHVSYHFPLRKIEILTNQVLKELVRGQDPSGMATTFMLQVFLSSQLHMTLDHLDLITRQQCPTKTSASLALFYTSLSIVI